MVHSSSHELARANKMCVFVYRFLISPGSASLVFEIDENLSLKYCKPFSWTISPKLWSQVPFSHVSFSTSTIAFSYISRRLTLKFPLIGKLSYGLLRFSKFVQNVHCSMYVGTVIIQATGSSTGALGGGGWDDAVEIKKFNFLKQNTKCSLMFFAVKNVILFHACTM